MITALHEALVALLREHPYLLAIADLPADGWIARPADLGEVIPTQLRADVLLVNHAVGKASVLEVQLAIDPAKRETWPAYQANARAIEHMETAVVVITLTHTVARWARKPIPLGGGSVFRAVVVCLADLPVDDHVTDPHLAVLIALGHARGPHAERAVRAALRTLPAVDRQAARDYTTLMFTAVSKAVRRTLEAIMLAAKLPDAKIVQVLEHRGREKGLVEGREQGREEGREQGREEGREEGEVAALRRVLAKMWTQRFGDVPNWADLRLQQADADTLANWALATLDATSLEDVLGAQPS